MGVIFLQLLNRSITAGWLILAVLCVRFLFRKMPKWVNCLLWGVVAVRLAFPFSIESILSLQPSAEPIRSRTIVGGEVLPYVPSLDSNLPVVENTINPILAEKFAYSEAESVAPLQVVAKGAGIVWVVGMIILLAFAWGSMIRLFFLIKESVRYKNNVYICDRVKSPFILGIIRPRIYLSSSLTENEIEYIMAHEKAHLKRKDHLWKPFGYLLLCIYWFHPLCLVAYLMLCRDIELACDEKVIMDMHFEDKKEYSKVLLSCATQRRLVMACPLAFGEVGVKERVKTVLNYKKPTFWITIAAIVVCAIIAICFLTNPEKEYQIRITIPAGSKTGFYYSDEEICPKRNALTVAKGGRLGDTEVILFPVEAEENAYEEPVYITAVAPAKMNVEKGVWFKIGVYMQNPTAEDINVYVAVRGVEVRIATKTEAEHDSYEENVEMQNAVMPQNLETQLQEPDTNEVAVYEELIPENEYRAMLLEEEQTALPSENQGENVNNPEYIFYPERTSIAMPFNEVPVNTLPDVTMLMVKYKNYEGDIEIVNGSDSELQTGEWFCIQKWEEGAWQRLDELIDGIWKEVAYRLPAGETAVLQTSWKTWFGELPPGKYRMIKEVYVEGADRADTHYLAAEFEIH